MNRESPAARTLRVGDCHRIDLPMRWGDSDALNHMNNTVYFRMMEEARMQLLRGSGLSLPAGQGFILAHAACDFIKSFTYPCDVRVTHKVTRIGRSSLETELILENPSDATGPYARGRTVMVWIDYATNGSAPLPDTVLQALATQFVPDAPG